MKIRFVLFSALCFSSTIFAETLKDVLIKNKIPIQSFSRTELETKVSSGWVGTFPDSTVLAYPSAENGDAYVGPMFVIKRDGKRHTVIHQLLSPPQVSDVCLGAVWGIQEEAGKLLIETNISPSALCTLVLDSHLHF